MNVRLTALGVLLGLLTLEAEAKAPPKKGQALPPKFGGLIQPAPEGTENLQPGLISSELTGRDLEFLTETLELGRLQSWLVKQAQEKGGSPEMRSIGGALSDIQQQENAFVAKLAVNKGLPVPNLNVAAIGQKPMEDKLKPLTGLKLEKALLDHIVNTAEESVTTYEGALQSDDPEVRRLAEQMLPAAKSRLSFASKASGRSMETSMRPAFRTDAGGSAATMPKAAPASGAAAPPAPAVVAKPAAATVPAPASTSGGKPITNSTPAPAAVKTTSAPVKPAPAPPTKTAATPAAARATPAASPAPGTVKSSPAATPKATAPVASPSPPAAPAGVAKGAPATPASSTPSPAAKSATPVRVVPQTTPAPGPPPPKPPSPTPVPESAITGKRAPFYSTPLPGSSATPPPATPSQK